MGQGEAHSSSRHHSPSSSTNRVSQWICLECNFSSVHIGHRRDKIRRTLSPILLTVMAKKTEYGTDLLDAPLDEYIHGNGALELGASPPKSIDSLLLWIGILSHRIKYFPQDLIPRSSCHLLSIFDYTSSWISHSYCRTEFEIQRKKGHVVIALALVHIVNLSLFLKIILSNKYKRNKSTSMTCVMMNCDMLSSLDLWSDLTN
ncbi:hypothetical protein QYE76_015235 [Lolium multiflorum]|uniref:Uncharacterized protein n=1 Tax=Lolium multiflorum TaxID=4521 RepID=A0AAD8X686_LOLMU|nr:hypothetical protein QYE76_015235 [Lolium multiflorum]